MNNREGMKEFYAKLTDGMSDYDIALAALQGFIAAEISVKRVKLGLSQKDLAEKMGVTQTLVSRWEKGEVNFTLSTLVKIAIALDLQIQLPFVPSPPKVYTKLSNITLFPGSKSWAGASSESNDWVTAHSEKELEEM